MATGMVQPQSRPTVLVVAMACAALLVASLLPAAPAAAQVDPPAIDVSPSTFLDEDHRVDVSGTGFPPSTTLGIVMCPRTALDAADCDAEVASPPTVQTDSEGSFATVYEVSRYIVVDVAGVATNIDCFVEGCMIAVGDASQTATATFDVDFGSFPNIQVTPRVDLLDGQEVTISGSTYLASSTVYLVMCPRTAAVADDCDLQEFPPPSVTTRPDGTFDTTYEVSRYLVVDVGGVPTEIDCFVEGCLIAAGDSGLVAVDTREVEFLDTSEPEVAITPTTDLLDGQTVQIDGTGFLQGGLVTIGQCGPGSTSQLDCDPTFTTLVVGNDDGTFSTSYDVARDIVAEPFSDPHLIDCAAVACTILVDGPGAVADIFTPVAFTDVPRPTPELTATLDGDSYGTATVTGASFEPGENYVLQFCGPSLPFDCLTFSNTAVTADGTGAFSAPVPVARASATPGDGFDCLLESCLVVARRSFVRITDTPMVFPEPTLTLALSDAGTLMAGTNFADVAGTVTCDHSTPLSFSGTVAQPVVGTPTIAGGYALDDLFCVQGQPLRLFLPTRNLTVTDSDYSLGEATVEMSATPYRAFDEGPPTTATGTATLYDFDALAAAITALLADPANEAFRQQFIATIQARMAQDPIFRAEFIALFRAG